jgi:hypothetical protein
MKLAMGAGVRGGGSGGDVGIAAENWRCRWKKSAASWCEVQDLLLPRRITPKHKQARQLWQVRPTASSALPQPLCSWPQLYLLASALSIFSRLGWDSSLGCCYIRLPVYIPRIPISCMSKVILFLLHCKSAITPSTPSCDSPLPSLTQRHERLESILHLLRPSARSVSTCMP